MLRSILLLGIGIFLLQSQAMALVRIGVKAGVNFANLSASGDSVDFERTPGFTIGASGEVALAPALAVRTELLYVQKGAKFTRTVAGAITEGRMLLDEVVIAPFLVVRYPLPNLLPFFQIGPEFSFNTLAKRKDDGTERAIGQIWANNNFSVNVGAGVLVPVGPSDISLDFRYNLGLVDLHSGAGNVSTKTNGIQVFLGYNFFKI